MEPNEAALHQSLVHRRKLLCLQQLLYFVHYGYCAQEDSNAIKSPSSPTLTAGITTSQESYLKAFSGILVFWFADKVELI